MKQEEYIKTVVINNEMFNIGIDVYSQNIIIEFAQNGHLEEVEVSPKYCGYKEAILSIIEKRSKNGE